MKIHKDLKAWKLGIRLAKEIYELTENFPRKEQFGLSQQMRRAAISIPSNIAEGASRNSKQEFMRFLSIARGSASELETQFIISLELGFIKQSSSSLELITGIQRMISGLIRSLK